MFIGQHGSWNRSVPAGYKVVFVPFADGKPSGMPVDVLTGFVSEKGEAWGRPVGVELDKSGALLVADDVGNIIWRAASEQRSATLRAETVAGAPTRGCAPLRALACQQQLSSAGRRDVAPFDPDATDAPRAPRARRAGSARAPRPRTREDFHPQLREGGQFQGALDERAADAGIAHATRCAAIAPEAEPHWQIDRNRELPSGALAMAMCSR